MNNLNHWENINHSRSFEQFLQEIEKMNARYSGVMWWVISYETSENNTIFAKNFFENDDISEEIIAKKVSQFHEEIERLLFLQNQIEEYLPNTDEKEFLLLIIENLKNKFEIFKNAIFLEAEKSGFTLSCEERKNYQEKVDYCQDLVYGKRISQIPEEVDLVMNYLDFIFQKNSYKISDSDKKFFEEFLSKFPHTDFKSFDIKQIPSALDVIVPEEKIQELFAYLMHDIYGLIDWKIQIKETAKMFAVNNSKKELVIPRDKMKNLSLWRLLQLFDHEIGVHAIRGENTSKTLKIPGKNYLEHEEWWAMLSEKLFSEDIKNLQKEPTIHHITTFFAENNNEGDTQNLIRIFFEMTDNFEDPYNRMRRVKRFVSDHLPGANRKDVTYTRGNLEIIKHWQELYENPENRMKFLKDFYFSKLHIGDQKFIAWIKKNMNVSDIDLIYPLWIGKMLAKKLQWEKIFLHSHFDEDDERVNFIDQDGRFAVKTISFDVQRKVVSLLQMFRDIK